jgi:invasion protein IalB
MKAVARALAATSILTVMTTAVWSQPKPAQGQPPAASPSGRTEILTYDNWTVTCRDPGDPKEKRVCSAELDIVQDANGQRRTVLAWIIGLNKEGVPTTVIRFPPGVSVAPGIELKFADKSRKIPIATCEPSYCEATAPMDDAFIKDASAIVQAEAVVQASDGRAVNFTINMKGFAQALALVRK